MIASHRDACILSKYAHDLTHLLEGYYQEHGLDDYVIAYSNLVGPITTFHLAL